MSNVFVVEINKVSLSTCIASYHVKPRFRSRYYTHHNTTVVLTKDPSHTSLHAYF